MRDPRGGSGGRRLFLLNPYCNQASPFQTSFRGLATYIIPRVDVIISGVYQDKPAANNGTDQLTGSFAANYTLSAADHRGRRGADRPSADDDGRQSRST